MKRRESITSKRSRRCCRRGAMDSMQCAFRFAAGHRNHGFVHRKCSGFDGKVRSRGERTKRSMRSRGFAWWTSMDMCATEIGRRVAE